MLKRAEEFLEHDYNIIYIKGTKKILSDLLYRLNSKELQFTGPKIL